MAGMKRWLAGFLAGLLLFTWTAALGEGSRRDTVEIQESLVSREDDSEETLEDHILILLKLVQEEEVRNLLQIEDVKTIMTEIVVKVLVWMIQNRPVTMKILTEFGVGETDLRCIEKIWDSADRIQAAADQYLLSEEGNSLAAEYNALANDPDFTEALKRLLNLLSSEDVRSLVNTLAAPEGSGTETMPGEGVLTQEALNQHLDDSSFLGSLLLKLMRVLEQGEQAAEALPALLENENLWRFLTHLTDSGTELNRIVMEEYNQLTADPEIAAFTGRTLSALAALAERVRSEAAPDPDSGEKPEETEKETAP